MYRHVKNDFISEFHIQITPIHIVESNDHESNVNVRQALVCANLESPQSVNCTDKLAKYPCHGLTNVSASLSASTTKNAPIEVYVTTHVCIIIFNNNFKISIVKIISTKLKFTFLLQQECDQAVWVDTTQDQAVVIVSPVLSPSQITLKAASSSWTIFGVQRCRVMTAPSQVNDCLLRICGLVFDDRLVPKPWALKYCSHSTGASSLHNLELEGTGRLDLRFPDMSPQSKLFPLFERMKTAVRDLLNACGLTYDVAQHYTVTDMHINVAFQRCQRQPFQSCGQRLSGPFEELIIMFPFKRGCPIAFLDSTKPLLVDGSVKTAIPEVAFGQALVFTETAFC